MLSLYLFHIFIFEAGSCYAAQNSLHQQTQKTSSLWQSSGLSLWNVRLTGVSVVCSHPPTLSRAPSSGL